MVRLLWALGAAVLIIGGAVMARQSGDEAPTPYLACADQRIMTYGTGQRTEPVAEMAAIVRWQGEAAALGEGYDNWALAETPWLQCHTVHNTVFIQCKIAGRPCKANEDAAQSNGAPGQAAATAGPKG